MSEHTKGRLAVNYDWIVPADHANRPIGSSTDKNRDRECYAHVVAFTHSKYHDQAANARRLVACWNMFPDIDTDVIEVMPTFTEFQQANDEELRAVLHELNAARALLREVISARHGDTLSALLVRDRITSYLDACDKPGEPT